MNKLKIWIWILVAVSSGWAFPTVLKAQNTFVQGEPRLATWFVEGLAADRVIVVVHGGPGVTHDYLRPELDVLADWGELVYYDQRGCGESDKATSYTLEDHVDDLNRVIQTFNDQREVVLVATSWGVTLTVRYLEKYPHEHVVGVILSGFGRPPHPSLSSLQSEYSFFPIPEDLIRPRTLLDSVRVSFDELSLPSTRPSSEAPRQSEIPPEIEARLEFCEAVNRQTIESLASARGGISPLSLDVPSVVFLDEDDGGEALVEPWDDEGHRRVVKLPGHDPWFTHSRLYRTVIGEFFQWLDQGAKHGT